MGIRMTQDVGIPKAARDFLASHAEKVGVAPCPHCGKATKEEYKKEVYEDAKSCGMFDDGPVLVRYHLKDGGSAEEFVQEVVWSSGPVIFLGLRDGDTGEDLFVWPEEALSNA